MLALAIGALVVGNDVRPIAPKPVETLLGQMRRAYRSVESVQLSISVRSNNENGVSSGVLSVDFVSPNRLRYAAQVGSNEARRYCDGREVVTIRPGTRESRKEINVDTLGGQLPGNLEWLCFFDWRRQLSTQPGANMAKSELAIGVSATWRDRKWTVLEERAPEQGVYVRYFIDPKTFFIWRCDASPLKSPDRITRTEVRRMALGVRFAAGHFEAPPATASKPPSRPSTIAGLEAMGPEFDLNGNVPAGVERIECP